MLNNRLTSGTGLAPANKGPPSMRLRVALIALAAMPALAGTPALAQNYGGPGGPAMMSQQMTVPQQPYDRAGWLGECRRRLGDNGVGGAVIGGVLGGAAGNVIAGRGNRAVGTVVGAVAGAVAGAAIDKGEDRAAARDRCEAMLDGFPGYASFGGYDAPPGYMLVPVQTARQGKGECKETVVTEEFVTDPPFRAVRRIPRRAPDKRVRMVADKRVLL